MTNFVFPHGDLLIAPEQQPWVDSILSRLTEPAFAETFTQKVNDIISSSKSDEKDTEDDDDFWAEVEGTYLERYRPYKVKNGVLTIPVQGMLLKGFPYTFHGMLTGYEYIEQAVRRGVADPEVKVIRLDVNSPGGTVSGCFDCADSVYEATHADNGTQIIAFANEHAYSAAYAIGSAAEHFTVARTGGVGSVGVITTHVDASKALEQSGLKVTPIFAGKHKADGNSFEALPDNVKAKIQERVDALHAIFVSTVARNRGLEEATVRKTEAATFMAQEAVETGFADAVGPLGSLSAPADDSNDNDEDEVMSDVTQADHDAAVAAATETGKTEGATAERTRVSEILNCEEAKTRPAAAQMMIDLGIDAEQAKAQLAKLPEEANAESAGGETPSGGSAFEQAMENGEQPNLGAGGGEGQEQMSTADAIFASAGYDPIKK